MTAIHVDELVVHYGARRLLGPLSFVLEPGARLGLRGPSGAGKSTVLRVLVGLLPPELAARGQVRTLGIDVLARNGDLAPLRARAVLVGQTPVVFPGSILANALFGLRHVVRATRTQLEGRAKAALVEAALWGEVADRLHAPADQLSIGQRQRLCLARALALDPTVLLLDEPTSSLDPAATSTVEAAIAGLQGSRTVLVVSHDGAQLERLCESVVELGSP